jgi:hypothetical protein
LPHYERLYRRGAYAPPEERRRLLALLKGLPSAAMSTNDSEDGDWMRRGRSTEPPATPERPEATRGGEPLQQSLF